MRYFLFILILFLPWSYSSAAVQNEDSLRKVERVKYYMKYRLLKDTIKVNTWGNLKRLNDNLEKIVEIDNILLDSIHPAMVVDSQLIRSHEELNARHNELLTEYDRLHAAHTNNLQLLLYLKVAIAAFALIAIILLFIIIGKQSSKSKLRKQCENYESAFEEKRIENEGIVLQLTRLKNREAEFREELERGMQANQARLTGLLDKCSRLEEENKQLQELVQEHKGSVAENQAVPQPPKIEIPEDEDERAQLIRSLSEERESLMKLAGQLQSKLENEKTRRKEMLARIDTLVRNLSQIGGES